MLVPLLNTLKHIMNKRNAQISMSRVSIISMLHGYSRQRCTISFFSATAGLLVGVYCGFGCTDMAGESAPVTDSEPVTPCASPRHLTSQAPGI